ncbi:hypothetical protein Ait01nite_016890 [Actinoplanes italicus]|uniref:Uncharacterized protein n=1 Tax=Actinoplanes italicus TaxID=113567 RepID=A0A2T0JZA7_9ACTN|nr:hypothetical protein CLV67_12286 [Actinoplanes italicus]GIE28644.1 hypothetical protein Ait01nite_016890 [Actinoplanes italicus]
MLACSTGVTVVGTDYGVSEERTGINLAGKRLDAVLARPCHGTAKGLVVMVWGPIPSTIAPITFAPFIRFLSLGPRKPRIT